MSRYRDDTLDAWIGLTVVVGVVLVLLWLVGILVVGW